jgi:type I restriction enzyme S subunit
MRDEPQSTPWATRPLATVARLTMGQAPPGEAYNDHGEGYALIAGAGDLGPVFPSPKKWTTVAPRVCDKDDIIVCVRATIGDTNWADRPYCLGRGVAGVRAGGDIDRRFLAYWIQANADYLRARGRGSTFLQISKEDLSQLPVPVPKLDEQRRIVARIEEAMQQVDEVQLLHTANLATSHALLPALLKEQFAAISGTSESATIGGITVESRYGTSEKCSPDDAGTPVLRIPNVADRRCNLNDLKYLPHTIDADNSLALVPGDVLVVRTNGSPELVGRCAVVPKLDRVFGYASYLIRLRLDQSRARPSFVSYYLSSTFGRDQIARLRRTSAGQYNINGTAIASIELPLPPVDVQDAMVARMDRIDAAVRDVRARLEAQAERDVLLPPAILAKAFAGEL